MKRLRPPMLVAVLLLLALPASRLVAAGGARGDFHFGKVRFTPADAFAYQQASDEGTYTVVALTNFKIDRADVLDEIITTGAFVRQAGKVETGAVVVVSVWPDKCAVAGFLNETQQQIDLGRFPTRTKVSTAARIVGECRTTKPQTMFDDTYDFQLSYDVPLTVIPQPSTLPKGGGEPGKAYAALIRAILAADWTAAHTHLRPDEVPKTRPQDMKNYFEGLSLNYPKSATITGGLMKGERANLDVRAIDHDGKKTRGTVALKKISGEWQVLDQTFYFDE